MAISETIDIRQACSEGGSNEPPFFARQSVKRTLIIIIMSCYARPSRIDVPSVNVDLAIMIDRIPSA